MDQAIAHIATFAPGCVLLGHGSFFHREQRSAWGDVDLVVLTKDRRTLSKTRSAYRDETLDVTWCGLENLGGALGARAAIGQADLARAVATGKRLGGDEAPAARAQQMARDILNAGPLPFAVALADRLRLRLTLRLDDRARLTTAQRPITAIEDCGPTMDLGMLSRNQWIVSAAYSELWSADTSRFVAEIEEALRLALAGDDTAFCAIVRRELSRAGGELRRWPIDREAQGQPPTR